MCKIFDNHKQLHPTIRTQISKKDVKLVALPKHEGVMNLEIHESDFGIFEKRNSHAHKKKSRLYGAPGSITKIVHGP